MKRSLMNWAVMIATCCSGFLVGCGPGEAADVAQPGLGLTVTRQSEMDLTVVAQEGEAQVTLVVRRLGLRGTDFVRDPEVDSPYDADLTVRNRHGQPFLTSGEHGPSSAATADELSTEPLVAPDHEEQVADLQLAVEAVERLRATTAVGTAFSWELRSLHYLAASALERADDALKGEIPASAGMMERAGMTKLQALSPIGGGFTHRVSIRYTSCCVALGNHSAVLLEVFDSAGTFVGMVSTRNHGRDATDPSMVTATGCPRSFGGRATAFPNFRPYYATDADWNGAWGDGGGCETPYGFTPGRHVCNDDSQAQYWNLKYGVAGTWATCSDRSLRWWSPYCD
jgi:hypothetical protein